MEAMVGMTF